MNRREMLVKMLGLAAATAIATLIDLTDQTPNFWNQVPLMKVMPWRITFPDGTWSAFEGRVIAEQMLDDRTVSLTIRPEGAVKMDQDESPPAVESSKLEPASTTVLETSDSMLVELMDIEPTRDDATARKDFDGVIPGLRRMGNLTFAIKPL